MRGLLTVLLLFVLIAGAACAAFWYLRYVRVPSNVAYITEEDGGITMVDLYIPILTFVFGEAQMGGPCGLVSGHRLQQQFYGLPEDEALFDRRLLTEAAHELGHTLQLTHCDDYQCAMAASHGVEWMDLKQSSLCSACEAQIFPRASSSVR